MRYGKRSPVGLANQGWKDSDEAIRHADGRVAEPRSRPSRSRRSCSWPCSGMAEIMVVLEDDGAADALLDRAAALQRRWHEAFWMPREGFYAMALDADGDQVASVTSNPGHALGVGDRPDGVARRVADRLLSRDLFSGWGVRTLSEDHPSYNPLAYHLGTVWPVENATFALGLQAVRARRPCRPPGEALLEAAPGLGRGGGCPRP